MSKRMKHVQDRTGWYKKWLNGLMHCMHVATARPHLPAVKLHLIWYFVHKTFTKVQSDAAEHWNLIKICSLDSCLQTVMRFGACGPVQLIFNKWSSYLMTNVVTADLKITSFKTSPSKCSASGKMFSEDGSDVGIKHSLTGTRGGVNDEPLTAHDWRSGGGWGDGT